MPHRVLIVLLLAMAAQNAAADELLYRWEGDVLPYDESAGWLWGGCDEYCSESLEDGHLVLTWDEFGELTNYTYAISDNDGHPPPPETLWIEWRFRSDVIKPSNFFGCDGKFKVRYANMSELVNMFADATVSFEGGDSFFGLDPEEFHTYRFESTDGRNYSVSVDGLVFLEDAGVRDVGPTYLQMRGQGGCVLDDLPSRNEWDFVRYGTIGTGERIVRSDPPQGFLNAEQHAGLDRFTVTFDQPNYVYIDDITVTVSDDEPPVVLQTRRLDNGAPETVQIVLDRPLPLDTVIRFDFLDDGKVTNSIVYGEAPPIPAVSTWGVVVTLLAILIAGTLVFRVGVALPA